CEHLRRGADRSRLDLLAEHRRRHAGAERAGRRLGRGEAPPLLPDRRGRARAVKSSTRSSLSLWSEDSFLSIASKGSALSIGSVGSFASIGSIGSAGSAFSVASAGSAGSVMSYASAGSVMSARARDSILGDSERTEAGALSAGILAVCALAVAGWVLYRR